MVICHLILISVSGLVGKMAVAKIMSNSLELLSGLTRVNSAKAAGRSQLKLCAEPKLGALHCHNIDLGYERGVIRGC